MKILFYIPRAWVTAMIMYITSLPVISRSDDKAALGIVPKVEDISIFDITIQSLQEELKQDTTGGYVTCKRQDKNELDTTDNYLGVVLLGSRKIVVRNAHRSNLNILYQSVDGTIPLDSFHVFRVRYMPEIPLLGDFQSYKKKMGGGDMVYKMNRKLRGQRIFEIYDITAHRLDCQIFAEQEVAIFANSSRWYDPVVFRQAMNYYCSKLHTGTYYYMLDKPGASHSSYGDADE